MAEANVSLDTSAWDAFLKSLGSKMKEPFKLLQAAFGVFGFKDIDDHFREEAGPNGPWPPRSPITNAMYDLIAAGKRNPAPGIASGAYSSSNKLLQLTGALRKSILPGNVRVKSKSSIVIFSNIKSYSGIHDTGGGRIPQREFMWLSKGAKEHMAQYILSVLEKSGNAV